MRAALFCLKAVKHPQRSPSVCVMYKSFADNNLVESIHWHQLLQKLNFLGRKLTTDTSISEHDFLKGLEDSLYSAENETISVKEKFHAHIEQLCKEGNLQACLYLLRYLRDRKMHLNICTYNVVLAASAEKDNLSSFSEIFKSLLLSNLPPDLNSYVQVMRALQKAAEPEVATFVQEVFEVTQDRDPTVMNRIIYVTAKYGELEKAMLVYEEMKKQSGKLDTVTFNTVLAILARACQVDRMLSEFSFMKNLGHSPDLVTYNTLINCLRRLGKLELCVMFSKEMIAKGIELDLRTYTALIDAFGRAGRIQDALKLFDHVKNKSMPISLYTYRAMISNLKKAGECEMVLKFEEEMKSNSSKLLGPEDFKRKHKNLR